MTTMNAHPDIVGSYVARGKREFYGAMRAELDRSGTRMVRTLQTYDFAPQSFVLTISSTPEVIQFAPFEAAVQQLGLFGINADDSPFDAGRVESISRQFSPVGMAGVSAQTLEGLKMMGHDPEAVFRGRVIWARPDAWEAVRNMNGVTARRCALIGPALGLDCADGHLHLDRWEWDVTSADGELILSSRLNRFEPLMNLQTGLSGAVSSAACSCGSADTVIEIR
jgi:hypothetical protein